MLRCPLDQASCDIAVPARRAAKAARRMEMRAAFFARLDSQGRIIEERRYYDVAGMLAQLGLMQ